MSKLWATALCFLTFRDNKPLNNPWINFAIFRFCSLNFKFQCSCSIIIQILKALQFHWILKCNFADMPYFDDFFWGNRSFCHEPALLFVSKNVIDLPANRCNCSRQQGPYLPSRKIGKNFPIVQCTYQKQLRVW